MLFTLVQMAKLPDKSTFTIDAYRSSKEGAVIESNNKKEVISHDRLKEDARVFSYLTYSKEVHEPYPLPEIKAHQDNIGKALKKPLPRCLDMPLRLAGERDYYLPEEWVALKPLLEEIIAIEEFHNENWQDYYTYLTVDSSQIEPFQQQRHGGLHVDGFQGERIDPKTKITRNYVLSTNGGTRFYPQRFVCADPKKYNVFQGFDIQAEDAYEAEESVVCFMDAYSVHESGFSTRGGLRNFIRLTYDLKKFDRKGNTYNSMLHYSWEMVERNVHEQVETPSFVHLEESPYY